MSYGKHKNAFDESDVTWKDEKFMKREEKKKMAAPSSKEPLISVLMCVYNPADERQLLQAVNSIIHQTYKHWEMLLYDDGSDERYRKQIQDVAALDPRIHYISGQENRGLAYGLNVCLSQAKGIYIARMDADDISDTMRFQKMIAFLQRHPEYQWVGCNTALIDGKGRWGNRTMPEIPTAVDFLKYSPYIHPAVMFRKNVLVACHGYRISRRGEDYELFMRLHAKGYRGYNLQEELFFYREDRNTYHHRKYLYQIEEVGIRFRGFRSLKILKPTTFFYVIKPLMTGIVPYSILFRLKKTIRKEMHVERYKRRQTQQV